jgi:nitrogen regulatory protein PII
MLQHLQQFSRRRRCSPPCQLLQNLQALIRPWRLARVVEQLNASGIRGMTVSDVKGAGVQGGEQARQGRNLML